jgi:hypothetical protein
MIRSLSTTTTSSGLPVVSAADVEHPVLVLANETQRMGCRMEHVVVGDPVLAGALFDLHTVNLS